jgi:hypothetical protein
MAESAAPAGASDEVKNLLDTPPPWIIRRGATTAVVAFSLLVLAAWMVRIPESIEASATLQTEYAPVRFRVPQSCPQFAVFVKDGDTVNAGSWLAVRKTSANPLHILKLRNLLSPLQTLSGVEIEQIFLPDQLRLGPLDEVYQIFRQTHAAFIKTLNAGSNTDAATSLDAQMTLVKSSIRTFEDKLRREQRVLEQRRNSVREGQTLIRRKELTYEAYALRLKAMKSTEGEVRDIELDVQRERRELERLERWKVAIRQQAVDRNYQGLLDLRRELRDLLDAIQTWENEHIFSSPIAGRVNMKSALVPGKLYRNNFQDVLGIHPFGQPGDRFTALLYLEGSRAGKVMPGQSVFIQVEGYPVTEFGFLRGKVQDRPYYSGDPERQLTVDVLLDEELTTTTGYQIPYDFALRGEAEIIIENDRFLHQLLRGFAGLF